ncbi:hypothetical protein [Saccharothrix violaceirubra]|uniref:Uncharacterized protein n=1 Tax=Saccharothrix violaceirubra TaxID=413306 RepID=A0A7W7WV31_9PSEU|nr:hypothetical protein [Saccharothrix violaceirubra]MBB4964502.1 hypothetical protein [Saccharothrix violaceirubra]
MHKKNESGAEVRYRFHADREVDRYLMLDKRAETIQPADGDHDGVFQAAAGKLARAWVDTKAAPDRLIHQS